MESYREAVNRARREYLTRVMRECGFIVARAAAVAGCNRTDFYKQLAKYAPKIPRRRVPPEEHAGRNPYGEIPARRGNAAWRAFDQPEARA